ncbi:methyltransferase domain-containing protein [Pontimicrobium sp. SW4]|uniref:Methyltransferase domain-containing protein n=1 Tax=Pontimicrobium sp. SW4 TaxID=3153519 RepID=A0AAU7BWM6_9FLAO
MNFIKKYLVLCLFPMIGYSQYSQNDWAERDTWMPIEKIFELASISEGSHVADIGCHEGYLSIHLANKVGTNGKVYAVDVREDRLDLLEEHLKTRELNNVSVILGDYDNPKLPNVSLDVVVIMDTYHEMKDYMTILEHVKLSLKPGGRIVIIEKQKLKVRDQSRASQTDAHSMSIKYVRKELINAGFNQLVQKSNIGFWQNDKDKVIWMLIATKE